MEKSRLQEPLGVIEVDEEIDLEEEEEGLRGEWKKRDAWRELLQAIVAYYRRWRGEEVRSQTQRHRRVNRQDASSISCYIASDSGSQVKCNGMTKIQDGSTGGVLWQVKFVAFTVRPNREGGWKDRRCPINRRHHMGMDM